VPVDCPGCESTIDPDRLNAAAQTARCEHCGEVRPRVSIPTHSDGTPDGSIAGWEFTWTPGDYGMNVVARRQRERPGILGYGAGMLAAAPALVAHGAGRVAWIVCGPAVAFGVLCRSPVTLRLARDRVALKVGATRPFRSVPTEDVFQFQVTRRRDSEGGESFAVAMHVGCELITIWGSPPLSAAQIVCNRLNEALFLVLGPPKAAPYR
jgi:hypothetical protein